MSHALTKPALRLDTLVSIDTVRVPPYPATALALQRLLATDTYTAAQLVQVMSADPVFTGNLLRLANSPFYRRGGEVTSLAVAAQRLGGRELVRFAMASAMARLTRGGSARFGPQRHRLWRQAVGAALVTETLCRVDGADPDEGFVAGLLHDAGKLLVLEALDAMTALPAALDPSAVEAMMEREHVHFGTVLAERWTLPGSIGAVIATHHEPVDRLGPLALRVARADVVVELLERTAHLTAEALEAAGLPASHAPAVAAMIPGIPAAVAALGDGAHGALPRPVRREARVLQVDGEPVPWPVEQVQPSGVTAVAARAIAPSVMVEATLMPEGMRCFYVVAASTPRGAEVVVELTPFALSLEQAEVLARG